MKLEDLVTPAKKNLMEAFERMRIVNKSIFAAALRY
jgi:hypothetical protein